MIHAFRKSLFTCWGVRIAAAALIVFLWIHDLNRGYQIYIPIVATLLAAAVGFLLSRLLGNLVASNENTRLLGILHMDLDPDRFIDAYREIPAKVRKGTRDHAVLSSYLADGYAAAGNPEQALLILEEGFGGMEEVLKGSQEKDLPLQGLWHGNRLLYLLDAGKTEEAKKAASAVEKLITACEKTNRALAENLRTSLLLRRARISIAEGTRIDDKWLVTLVSGSTYHLRRLEIYRTIVENALLRGDRKEASEYIGRLQKEGGKTWFSGWAEEAEKKL